MQRYVEWNFPLPRTHTGIMMGNARTGLLVWGGGDALKITIGRADLWDHRGGMPDWNATQSYAKIRKCLEADDADGIKRIFACATEGKPGQPPRPSVVPLGRFDLKLERGAELKRGRLDLKTAEAKVSYEIAGMERTIKIQLSMNEELALVELPEDCKASVECVPSWSYLHDYLSSISFEPPELFKDSRHAGWVQRLPADPAVCAYCRIEEGRLWIATERGGDTEALKDACLRATAKASKLGAAKFAKGVKGWWSAFWKDIPKLAMPNARLEQTYSYGMYKFACFTNPSGVPASLQGPWIEEYAMPPWSSDYHFNINVQMCYWPAYKARRLGHLKPIFDLVWSWREKLRANAKAFVGIDDGYMLPHAVDDRCVCMGSFWTGTIDHACAAWMAQMMFSYCQYTLDRDFLKGTAFPFMKGVMRVYEEMIELSGGKYALPVSVSPEYRGAQMDAWGRDASFQLAAVHRLCEDLIDAAEALGEKPSPKWRDILERLPKATLTGKPGEERIALWQGTDLEESHRHHSHLGAICPFDSIDIYSDEWRPVVERTIRHWTMMGMGRWTGWCMTWASMIHSRLGNGGMAELLLEIWERVFTNEGYGSLHDCDIYGFTVMGGPSFGSPPRREVMQMDAAMGAVAAIQDIFMHTRRGGVHIMPGVPPRWRDCSFKGMPCEGGFLIGAERKDGTLIEVSIDSPHGGTLRVGNPWGPDAKVKASLSSGEELRLSGAVLEIKLAKGVSARLGKA